MLWRLRELNEQGKRSENVWRAELEFPWLFTELDKHLSSGGVAPDAWREDGGDAWRTAPDTAERL